MMSQIERMRALDAKQGKETERLEDWDSTEKEDWQQESEPAPGNGISRQYSNLSQRFGRVRTGDWGMSGGKKRPSSLRKERLG
jgi:hypothetical protein